MSRTDLYRRHLTILNRYLSEALEGARRQGLALEGVLFHAGRPVFYHRDDHEVYFWPTAHFSRWVPLEGPEHVVLAVPGKTPRVVQVRPKDYWYDSSPPAASYWEEAVELGEAESFAGAITQLGSLEGIAYVGDSVAAAAEAGIPENLVEPEALMAPLDWYRASKTEHEIDQLRRACKRAAQGHLAARTAFEDGDSEREIHWAYLRGANHLERELPYGSIIALDEKAAILHYQEKRGREAAPGQVLLIDAGASWERQAADLTRTWARPGTDETFLALLHGMDAIERKLVAMVTPARPYLEIHLETHRLLAQLLAETGLLTASAEEALAAGVTRTFLPHGVGHLLGLQVHDAGGHQAGPEGGKVPPPPEHPFLRNTRILGARPLRHHRARALFHSHPAGAPQGEGSRKARRLGRRRPADSPRGNPHRRQHPLHRWRAAGSLPGSTARPWRELNRLCSEARE